MGRECHKILLLNGLIIREDYPLLNASEARISSYKTLKTGGIFEGILPKQSTGADQLVVVKKLL